MAVKAHIVLRATFVASIIVLPMLLLASPKPQGQRPQHFHMLMIVRLSKTMTAEPAQMVPDAPQVPQDGITEAIRSAWGRVATCETHGNWSMQGPYYSGGLGFSNGSWDQYGGRQFASNAGLATEDQQIIIARRINGSYVPDQYGCSNW